MKLEWDELNNVITLGKSKFACYHNFKDAIKFAKHVCRENGVKLSDGATPHERNKELGDALGCSAATLFKHFNKLQTKAFIAPVYNIYKAVHGYTPRKKGAPQWSADTVRKVNFHKHLLQEVERDGLKNILPMVFAMGKSPQELKKKWGSAWKIVAKQSLNKNRYLSVMLRHSVDEVGLISADLPTTLLKSEINATTEVFLYLKNNFKGSWKDSIKMGHEARLYRDTKYMADDLGVPFNPNWSARRMKEEHDKFSHEITASKYSKDIFDTVKEIDVTEVEHEGYVATLLQSAFEIAEEGNSMGHCVATYTNSVKNGQYLVYSIKRNGERSSTLGVTIKDGWHKEEGEKYYILDQHYSKYNRDLADDHEIEIGKMIVKKLNEEKQPCTH